MTATTHHTGHVLRALRTEKNLTIGQLAKASATSAGYLYRIENSAKSTRIGPTVVARIAAALNVDASALTPESAVINP